MCAAYSDLPFYIMDLVVAGRYARVRPQHDLLQVQGRRSCSTGKKQQQRLMKL